MSKIGVYNLELQEQANELGFSTVQEALDNGYIINADDELEKKALVSFEETLEAYEKAHEIYEEDKKNIITKLENLVCQMAYPDDETIKEVIAFIKRGEE